jgi:hypothetical protein
MRIAACRIKDIIYTDEFNHDYRCASLEAQKRIDTLVRMIKEGGQIPNSMHVHTSGTLEGLYIGYVTRERVHWRLLFESDEENPATLVFLRVLTHKNMDLLLKDYKSCVDCS